MLCKILQLSAVLCRLREKRGVRCGGGEIQHASATA